MKWWMGGQTALLVVALLGIGLQQRRIGRLESEMVALQSRGDRAPTVLEVRGADRTRGDAAQVRQRLRALQAAAPVPEGEAPVAAKIDDHLWSDEGRAVIDDVVQAREEQERERRGNRFRQMAELRRDRMIDRAREDYDLDDAQADQLRDALTAYGEERREIWRAMRGDGDVDAAALMDRGEQAEAAMRTRLEAVLGEEGADQMLTRMRGPM